MRTNIAGFLLALLAIGWSSNDTLAMPACENWKTPKIQSRSAFYSANELYGRLGIVFGYRHAYLIEESGCYDMSRSKLSKFQFLFNNAIEDDADSEPVFLGVTAIKTYPYPMREFNSPIVVTFYRNGNELEKSGDWALPSKPIANFQRGARVRKSEITLYDKRYEPEGAGLTASLDQVYSLIEDIGNSLVHDWHALLVAEGAEEERLVARNSYETRNLWKIDYAKINLIVGGVAIARNSLIKYRDSSSPKRQVFFTVENIGGAECLYVKLIRPGKEGPLLGLTGETGELVVFRLSRSAEC